MFIKVGDIVTCQNKTGRVLKVGGSCLTLSGFGKVNTKEKPVGLLKSATLPHVKKGYRVIICDIPEDEKTTLWHYLARENEQVCWKII